jgi:putative two-component system response regulator
MQRLEIIRPELINILVVDDEQTIRDIVQDAMEFAGFKCRSAKDGVEALEIMTQQPFDVVITDIMMPHLNGIDLTRAIKERYSSDVIMMTGYVDNFTFEDSVDLGVSDFMQKPVGVRELIIRVKRVLRERALLSDRNTVTVKLNETLQNLRKSMDATVQAIAMTVEARDPYTAGHQRRVAELAVAVAEDMGMSSNMVEGIRMAGVVHDLGKISIPAEILSKPSRLSEMEYELVKEHSQTGYRILKDIEFPWPIARIVQQHHERIDGSGYPGNLRSGEILIEARIIAVADVVEAMASHRPYRASLGLSKALEEISTFRGKYYEMDVVDSCLKIFREKAFAFS